MSLSQLVSGGAECGPSNPLQGFAKTFGQDRGTQQDRFVPQAGPSSAPFRSIQRDLSSGQDADASRFFGSGTPSSLDQTRLQALPSLSPPPHTFVSSSPTPSQLRRSPAFQGQHQQGPSPASHLDFEDAFLAARTAGASSHQQFGGGPGATTRAGFGNVGWAADFLKQQNSVPLPASHSEISKDRSGPGALQTSSPRASPGLAGAVAHGNGVASVNAMRKMEEDMVRARMMQDMYMQQRQEAWMREDRMMKDRIVEVGARSPAAVDELDKEMTRLGLDPSWDEAFMTHEKELQGSQGPPSPIHALDAPTQVAETAAPPRQDFNDDEERDQLARTAGLLVSSVEHEQNPKFGKSAFLGLMKQIRDKQVTIEGNEMVEKGQGSTSAGVGDDGTAVGSVKGKGKARDLGPGMDVEMHQPVAETSSAPDAETYRWANAAAAGASGQLSGLPDALFAQQKRTTGIPSSLPLAQELEGRRELSEFWADEDAMAEERERKKASRRSGAQFQGDGGGIQESDDEDALFEEAASKFRAESSKHGISTRVPGATERWEEKDEQDEGERWEDEDFVGRGWRGTQGRGVPGPQVAEWDALQRDWDAFEATATGIRPVSDQDQDHAYPFQPQNPYLEENTTFHHARHDGRGHDAVAETILEREAAVQRDPADASMWFELGVQQQASEREGLAIRALRRAVELDPSYRPAWLALAVSYTNENDRASAYDAIEKWIEHNPRYADLVRAYRARTATAAPPNRSSEAGRSSSPLELGDGGSAEASKHLDLTALLIELARSAPVGEVDADVQIALGILFNTSEDYDKAVDCFHSALLVKPDDWQLYNRIGATLSNSGRSREALEYYHRALELNPTFIRSRFNLAIACISLKMYQEAAEHISAAVTLVVAQAESERLQQTPVQREAREQEEREGGSGKGDLMSRLWDLLQIARIGGAHVDEEEMRTLFGAVSYAGGTYRNEASWWA